MALREVTAARRLDRSRKADIRSHVADHRRSSARLARDRSRRCSSPTRISTRIAHAEQELNAYITVTARPGAPRGAGAAKRRRAADVAAFRSRTRICSKPEACAPPPARCSSKTTSPTSNAAIVQQLEDAGAVLLGKTNTHELGGGVTTINPFFGTTRNPVDRTRIPGGSSGGSAAAVVAHLCAAATGSDTGGSVRIPAAFCGCVGFKPTLRPDQHARPDRRVADLRSRRLPDAHRRRRADHVSRLSAAVRRSNPAESPFASACRQTISSTDLARARRRSLSRGGGAHGSAAHVSPTSTFPIDDKTMARVFDPMFSFEMWGPLRRRLAHQSGLVLESSSPASSRRRAHRSPNTKPALAALKEYQAAVDKLFDAVDVIVTPTVTVTAPPIAGPIDGMKILRNTWPFNAAGTPAISIPLRKHDRTCRSASSSSPDAATTTNSYKLRARSN